MAEVKEEAFDLPVNNVKDEANTDNIDGANTNINVENQQTTLGSVVVPSPWSKHFDINTNRYYYYNYITMVSVWEKPADYVEETMSYSEQLNSSNLYAAAASFNITRGSFSGCHDYWSSVNRPSDKAGRQLSTFFDLNTFEQNREEYKANKLKQTEHISGKEWKKINKEKKEMRAKRNLLELVKEY